MTPACAARPAARAGVRLTLTLAVICTAVPAAQAPHEPSYDVVPSAWITSDGSLPRSFPADTRNGAAYVFPSLQPGEQADSVPPFETDSPFFTPSNRFPDHAVFRWSDSEQQDIAIDVRRRPGHEDAAEISASVQSLTALRLLRADRFRALQRDFRSWLLCKAGCLFFGDSEDRFVKLDSTLTALWRGSLLLGARFQVFADRYLQPPREIKVKYTGTNALLAEAVMWGMPIYAGEVLAINWGDNAVYPVRDDNLLKGWSRPTLSARSELQIQRAQSGLGILPAGAPRLVTQPDKFGTPAGTPLPFPAAFAALFGNVFVPIYTPMDLADSNLFRYVAKHDEPAPGPPPYLFVLSPQEYAKTDPDGLAAANVSAYNMDGAIRQEPHRALQLSRRYVLIGVRSNDRDALEHELTRLLDDAVRGGLGPDESGYVMAVFANQTSLEVRRHVAVDGRTLENTRPYGETWGDVVTGTLRPLLATRPNPRRQYQPALIVHRIVSDAAGTPVARVQIRFAVADAAVLSAATVVEGDEFEQPHVSSVLRQ